MARPTLYFIRHGETDWNAQGRLQGQRDVPLNARVRVQAEEAGGRLRALVPHCENLDYVASPLVRTRETMERLRGAIGLEPARYGTDRRLEELCFGTWEGLTWKEIRKRQPQAWAARQRDKWGYVPDGGESYAQVADRVLPLIERIERDTVLVSHGGVARVLLALLCGLPREKAPRIDIWQGRVLVIEGGRHAWA